MARVMITGSTGYIGSHLLDAFLDAGHEVHALVRSSSGARERLSRARAVALHACDDGFESVRRAVADSRPDCVFHLASLFLASHAPEQVDPLLESNVRLGAFLLEAMAREGCRCLVNAGTSWQHYNDAAYDPVCLYAATKQAFEDIARYYEEVAGLRAVHLHLTDTYGPNDPRRKVLPLLIDALRKHEHLEMSPGEQQIDFVHVDDVATAFLRAMDVVRADDPRTGVFSVSSRSPVTLRSVVELLEELSGQKIDVRWGGRPYRPREVMRPWSRGEWLPGWRPRVTLRDGLAQLLRQSEGAAAEGRDTRP